MTGPVAPAILAALQTRLGVRSDVVALTDDYTITEADHGVTFTNEGSTGMVEVTLPEAPRLGFFLRGVVLTAEVLKFNTPSGVTLISEDGESSPGEDVSASTVLSLVELRYLAADRWWVTMLGAKWSIG